MLCEWENTGKSLAPHTELAMATGACAGQGRAGGTAVAVFLSPAYLQVQCRLCLRGMTGIEQPHTPHMCTPHTQQENEVRTNTFTLGKQLHQLPSHHRTPQITQTHRGKPVVSESAGDLVTSAAMHLLGMLRTGVQSREHSLTSQALTAHPARPLALLP